MIRTEGRDGQPAAGRRWSRAGRDVVSVPAGVLLLPERAGGRAVRAGRPSRHGPVFDLDQPGTWPQPDHATSTLTMRYGTAEARAWNWLHPRLTHRGAWLDHDGELPIIDGALIRLQVDHLPGDQTPKPVWLWTSGPHATAEDVDRAWQGFLRRFDIEHTFRFFKQHLGWTTPKMALVQVETGDDLRPRCRRPLDLAGHRCAQPAAPGPRPDPRPAPLLGTPLPARAANHHRAPRHDIGQTTKRHTSPTKRDQGKG
jgi:hypothetical protein